MVGMRGFEPPTPCPPDKCANQAALHPDTSSGIYHLLTVLSTGGMLFIIFLLIVQKGLQLLESFFEVLQSVGHLAAGLAVICSG
jgi:hypothetical protein